MCVYMRVLQSVAECCSVMQCNAVCYCFSLSSGFVEFQMEDRIVLWCRVVQSVAKNWNVSFCWIALCVLQSLVSLFLLHSSDLASIVELN